jgi:hypothetical protein
MAQTNFTPISLYYSTTAAAVPTAGNLVAGELAINTQDGKLFYKDAAGVVQTIASKDVNSGTFTNISVSGVATFGAGTVSAPSITFTGDTNTGIYSPAADTIAFTEGGVESMRINANGRVGIGLATYNLTLAVAADANGQNIQINGRSGDDFGQIFFRSNSNSNNLARIASDSNAALIFGTGSQTAPTVPTEAMRINSSGLVGIGTSSPTARVHAYSTTTMNQLTVDGAGTIKTGVNFASSGTTYGQIYFDNNAPYDMSMYQQYTTGSLVFGTNSTERMRITSSGNVGVGTTDPDYGSYGATERILGITGVATNRGRLSLQNTSTGTTGVAGTVAFFNGSTLLASLDVLADGATNSGRYVFNTVNAGTSTEKMRITSAGDVLIGSTIANAKLYVAGSPPDQNSGLFQARSTAAGDSASCVAAFVKNANDSTTSQVFVRFGINGYSAGCGQINANGATQAAFGAFSDSRLKENIKDLPSQLAKITALRPVEFDYIESEGGGHQTGFIAQEMQEVYPDAVGKREDGMLTVTGWNKTEARLVKAIQEQQALIENLTTRLNALEGK